MNKIMIMIFLVFTISACDQDLSTSFYCSEDEMARVQREALWCKENIATTYRSDIKQCFDDAMSRVCHSRFDKKVHDEVFSTHNDIFRKDPK